MNKLYIAQTSVWTEDQVDDEEALAALKADLPRKAARRMTRLGIQMSHVLKDFPIGEGSSLVYATTYSETRMIEKYLDSFPYPSPQGFQTSIHPSGVEQHLIRLKTPVREFFPLAGQENLLLRGLSTVELCSGEDLFFCGGEERGTWLLDAGLSSERNYAWALRLKRKEDTDCVGTISWSRFMDSSSFEMTIPDLVDAIEARRSVEFAEDGECCFALDWRG